MNKKVFLVIQIRLLLILMGIIPTEGTLGSPCECSQEEADNLIKKYKENFVNADTEATNFDHKLDEIQNSTVNTASKRQWCIGHLPTDCRTALKGSNANDMFLIQPSFKNDPPFYANCRGDIIGGDWMVVFRRMSYTENYDFYRNWKDYQDGFGNLARNFWWGLDSLHQASEDADLQALFMLTDFDGVTEYAMYDTFYVAGADDSYKLTIGGYSGTSGDFMIYHRNRKFTTNATRNDPSNFPENKRKDEKFCHYHWCGWWHNACCHAIMPTREYYNEIDQKGLQWNPIVVLKNTSVKVFEMMIRAKSPERKP